ncbi:hypothetical protein Ami103574_08860 [Aminipila butyrica]|uniref:Cell envelope-related transcriptional attenuator domain-containing protein n=1 Tax=Aminipila butyrica TaxID=433296 RepID=A0A858BU19_9FIRM|nr:M56 family metallopeptidase [Aminipila butyrica]QIB69433.1 hypothetical protein Ami103574_08860 [Aminipila butyrica]
MPAERKGGSNVLNICLTVLNMSITAGMAALIIMILRSSIGKALPRTFSYGMWAIVLYRMVSPVSFSSIFSMLGSIKPGLDTYTSSIKAASLIGNLNFEVLSGYKAQELGGAPLLPETPIDSTGGLLPTQVSVAPMTANYLMAAMVALWILGILLLLIYNAVSYTKLCRSMSTSTFFEDYQLVEECKLATGISNRRVAVYESDKVAGPFVYGIFKPRVMLPVSITHLSGEEEREQLRHILLHELYHIKRLDYLVKPLAFLAQCVHWFNPILWIAFRLFNKDMEMSCDEGAVKALKTGTREDYASTLLHMASNQGNIQKSCALAFRETNAGERVKHIIKYKKPGLAVGVISVFLIVLFAVSLLSNPMSLAEQLEDDQANVLVICSGEGTAIPDTFLLLGYNNDRNEVNIAFLPRDLEVLPDDGHYGLAQRKLSGYASENPPEAVIEKVKEMLGVEIDNYIKLDTGNFRDLVDALGGVEFDVPMKMVYEDPYQNLSINLEEGKQVLDGEKAEMLIRYRKGYLEGDLGRIEVQKAFLGAMIKQKSDLKIGSMKELYQLLAKDMKTDLELSKAKKLIAVFYTAKSIDIVNVSILQNNTDPFGPLLLTPETKEEVKNKF